MGGGMVSFVGVGDDGAILQDVGVAMVVHALFIVLTGAGVGGLGSIGAAAGYAHRASVSNSLMVSSSP